ncbi:MAG: phage Gp37/Gp68 family protein [Ancylobacter novellus]|uniref:Phage Gp37/Gp68 family protein n=1 Tax=Ancylobacter novellus TaxID=921 RepID=A0A2W5QZ77_ANCNO|nr:MAG: phage Gp37/Gp68 family protein [Ancylobacter novellus]
MADRTGIEWTDATWNPIVGCSVVSPGCTNCYAMKMAARIEAMQPGAHYAGTTQAGKAGAVWTGKLALAPDSILTQPLRWRRPRRIFVNSMGDLFHEDVPDAWIDRVFAIMALTPQHTYQVLTKRSARMREYLTAPGRYERVYEEIFGGSEWPPLPKGMDTVAASDNLSALLLQGHLPNVWLGVSTEDQPRADERVPDLLATPAAIRFVSAEPLLGPIDYRSIRRYNPTGAPWIDALRGLVTRGDYLARSPSECSFNTSTRFPGELPKLDLVIVGGENGPRPMNPDWARSLRDRCAAADTAFFFKQWGSWAPGEWTFDLDDHLHFTPDDDAVPVSRLNLAGADKRMIWSAQNRTPEGRGFLNVGKRAAGRLLDGVEHNAMPEARS